VGRRHAVGGLQHDGERLVPGVVPVDPALGPDPCVQRIEDQPAERLAGVDHLDTATRTHQHADRQSGAAVTQRAAERVAARVGPAGVGTRVVAAFAARDRGGGGGRHADDGETGQDRGGGEPVDEQRRVVRHELILP
jgi:hypothetical protein